MITYNDRLQYILNGCDEGIDNKTWLRIEIEKLTKQAVVDNLSKLASKICDYLNDNMVEPEKHIQNVSDIVGVEFIDDADGWQSKT